MALRWCILLALVAFPCVLGQQLMNFTNFEDLENDIAGRYGSADAEDRRREHLYCLGYFNESGNDFATGPEFTSFPSLEEEGTSVWSIYMQFPVLSFLDINRKGALFRVILRLAGRTDAQAATMVGTTLCQGAIEFYEVTTYAESVLVRLYFRSLEPGVTVESLNTAFRGNLAAEPAGYTIPFRGRIGVNLLIDETFNRTYTRGLPPGSNLHPGSTLPNDRDPTFIAIVLGTWVGNISSAYEAEEDLNFQGRASNPNPINYGLEAGDIVFSVIGSILLAGVLGLVILGFCVHPFFLS